MGVEHAVDASAMHAERRDATTNWGEALVSDLDGVGPVTARLLAEAGIETMAELLATDTPTLAMLARVSPAKAERVLRPVQGGQRQDCRALGHDRDHPATRGMEERERQVLRRGGL